MQETAESLGLMRIKGRLLDVSMQIQDTHILYCVCSYRLYMLWFGQVVFETHESKKCPLTVCRPQRDTLLKEEVLQRKR